MWFDGIRKDNTLYVATVSRGKDSTAMLRAIQIMGWPLDAIISMDIWFDDETPAELPELVAFKDEWDKKCFEHFGIEVTRVCALTDLENKRNRECEKYKDKYKLTYCDIFYKRVPIERESGDLPKDATSRRTLGHSDSLMLKTDGVQDISNSLAKQNF